jgi:PhnB protein
MPFDQLDREIDALLAGGDALTELAQLAAQLLDLPDENFRQRLKSDLERRAIMSSTAVRIPEGFRTVTPYITIAEGDKFIDFLKQTFGAEEVSRHSLAPGRFHAQVRIGDSMLMIGSGASAGSGKPVALHVYVDDCDAAWARAVAAGATSTGEPADRPYGERSGYVIDAFGNHLYIATRLPSGHAPAAEGSIFPYLHPGKARPYIDFLKRAFGAEELGVYESEGRVMHAAVRIGDSLVEMGEAVEGAVTGSSFYMYVENVDAVYERAVAAGATSVRPPVDQPYGNREAALLDPAGYTWYPASLISER